MEQINYGRLEGPPYKIIKQNTIRRRRKKNLGTEEEPSNPGDCQKSAALSVAPKSAPDTGISSIREQSRIQFGFSMEPILEYFRLPTLNSRAS